ncbi:MAG: DUF120 domain-containing protein [Candidatus Bathyarchaeia archaeon]
MPTLTLRGRVISGRGSGKKYVSLPWVRSQVEEKLGFAPFLGTLNLQLTEESTRRRRLLEKAESVEICPAEGYCVGLVYRAFVGGLECAVVLPRVAGYEPSLLEVISAVNLRERLRLKDGDAVEVTVNV